MIKNIITGTMLTILVLPGCTHPKKNIIAVQNDQCAGIIPSFRTTIQPILSSKCAVSGCHDGNSMPWNYSVYEELLPVLADSSFYYAVILDRKMPQSDSLSSAQYNEVKCWLKNGYPNN